MKKVNKSGKLKIVLRMINKLNLLKDRINAPHDAVELTDWEIRTMADVFNDIGKFEQLTDQVLYERLKNKYPNNEVIQRNIENLLMQ